MNAIRRLLLGMVVGLIVSGIIVFLIGNVNVIGSGAELLQFPIAQIGGETLLLLTGALLGIAYAGLFQLDVDGHIGDLVNGIPLGILAWMLLAVNLYPLAMGDSPMWQAGTLAETFPTLIIYLLMSTVIGVFYGLTFRFLQKPLGLIPSSEGPPEINTRVVILGGGYAGVAAASVLDQAFERDPSVSIQLVSSTNYMLHTPMLSEVSSGAVDAQHIIPPLRSSFRHVRVVQGAVDRVDCNHRILYLKSEGHGEQRQLKFDHLIVTTGGVPNFFGNKGVEENCFTFKSLDDAVLIRNQIVNMFERADFEEDAATRRRMLTFSVAGGGFAGVELIGGINDFARGIAPYYPNIHPEDIRLILIHSRDTILPELSVELGKYAQEKLEQRGVEFLLNTRVTGAEPGKVHLGDESIDTETFIWTAGNRPSPVLETMGIPLTKRGQIEVDAHLNAVGTSQVWAAGDCAQVPDPHSRTGFAPPTAQHALREGKVVGYNVAASIRGKPLKEFNFKALGSLAALGHQLAVAEIFGYRFSGLLAWLMWRAIYLSKLPNLEKQVRVGLDWLIDVFFPPDIVQTIDISRESSPSADNDGPSSQTATVGNPGLVATNSSSDGTTEQTTERTVPATTGV